MRTIWLLALAALVLLGLAFAVPSDGREAPQPVASYLAAGGEAFQEGDILATRAAQAEAVGEADAAYGEAVGAWMDAAAAWRRAFRLLDPEPAHDEQRALIAFRIARAFAKAARHTRDPRWAGMRADHAFLWLDQTARLAPTMRQVHYERAWLFDSEVPNAKDPVAAHGAYLRYLAAVDALDEPVPEAEARRVARARERVAALTPPK